MSRILQASQNFWSERAAASVGVLVDGDDYYRAFYDAGALARRYILLSGWQFDSDACLLRGEEAKGRELPVTLKAYLNALCEKTPELRIYMLAWDFHAIFALEREWMQELVFNWGTSERLTFRFDASHVENGSHHQKFVVIDGQIAFLGGLDLCDHRWDTRNHRDPDPLRTSRGAPHKPFHDIQVCLSSPEVATDLTELFRARWLASGGKPLALPPPSEEFPAFEPKNAVRIATDRVALSRTDPHGAPTGVPDTREIRKLYLDAIRAARRLIYIETQYFSSKDVSAALVERLRTNDGSVLDVVLVLNMAAATLKEEVAVGLAQARVIGDLRRAAQGQPHRLGIYYTLPLSEGGVPPMHATYIHSKTMIVDDRFITIGSANLTNRSMGVDTELNMSAETESDGDALGTSIADLRWSLLQEHLGMSLQGYGPDLVSWLDENAKSERGRLRLHPSPTENEKAVLEVIDPQMLPFDPAAIENTEEDRSIFVGGIGPLWARLTKGTPDPSRTS
jgi:phosphatidylserine/phosphatidylglycerophosphate/cardiolipin synthase-like enzyme